MFANTRAARLTATPSAWWRVLGEDYPISVAVSVLVQAHEGMRTTIGRPHIADALVAAGVYRTRSEAFADAVSASHRSTTSPRPSPTTHEVLAAVAAAGGVVIIAHPGAV